MPLTLILLSFLLSGVGWIETTQSQPSATKNIDNSPTNPLLTFFLTTSTFIIIGYGQVVLKKLLANQFPLKTAELMDLCSFSNHSLLILDQALHGYYIHGLAPTGNSDCSIDELKRAFKLEEAGKARSRGIHPDDKTNLQSFEVYITFNLRQHMDAMFKLPVQEEIEQQYKETEYHNINRMGLRGVKKVKMIELDFERLEDLKLELNRQMKVVITNIIKNASRNILDKKALQRMCSMPPESLNEQSTAPFFYKDPGLGFSNILLCGSEWTLLLNCVLFFACIQMFSHNTYLSVFVTLIFDYIFVFLRKKYGTLNVSRKTLVDDKFLI